MDTNSIERLLLRHYGYTAPTPPRLAQRLTASVKNEVVARQQQEQLAANIRTYRLNRRRAVKLVAISSAGLGLLGVGLEILETALSGTDTSQPALS
jgi:hypothetical protein